jgi:hypothetical protein
MIISLALQNMDQLLAHLSLPHRLLGMSSTVHLEHLEKPIWICQFFYQLTSKFVLLCYISAFNL